MEFDPEKTLERCREEGADQAELYIKNEKSLNIEIEKKEIKYVKSDELWGVGIRVIVDGKPGFSSTTNPSEINRKITDAVKHAGKNQKTLKTLGKPGRTPEVKGIYSKEVAEQEYKDILPGVKQMIESANQGRSRSTSGNASAATAQTKIINTNGVNVNSETTMMQASISTIAGEGENTSTSYEFQYSRQNDIDYSWIGSQASKMAVKSLSGQKTTSGEKEVVLRPIALTSLLSSTLIPSLNAREIQKGRSKAKQLMNTQIAPEQLNITDDGTLEGGLNSRETDDEGTPSQKNGLIENGVLKKAMHNLKTSQKKGVESTGNGVRPSYGALPEISPRNLVIEPQTQTENLHTEDTIVVRSVLGAHTANQASGDFSVGTNEAFVVKDGDLQPVKGIMVSGNIFELLQDIIEIGDDVRKIGNTVTPSVKTKLRIST